MACFSQNTSRHDSMNVNCFTVPFVFHTFTKELSWTETSSMYHIIFQRVTFPIQMEHVRMHNVEIQFIIKWFKKGFNVVRFYCTYLIGHEIQAERRVSARVNFVNQWTKRRIRMDSFEWRNARRGCVLHRILKCPDARLHCKHGINHCKWMKAVSWAQGYKMHVQHIILHKMKHIEWAINC